MFTPAKHLFAVAALAAAGFLSSGCAGQQNVAQNPLEYTENARKAYDEALDAFFDQDWEEAKLLFEEVRKKYGYSRYARLAELRIADIAYHQDNFAEALTGYKGFVHDYPNDPEVVYARYKVAKSHFEQSGESILLPPLEERDLANVHDAYSEIQSFLADYPNYKRLREMQYMLAVVTGVLARHELYVARFYLAEDNFQATVARCQYALRNYPDSGLEAEAMVLLAETYLKMKKRKRARAVLREVLAVYPDSPFIIPAKRFMKLLGEDPEKVPAAPVDARRQ